MRRGLLGTLSRTAVATLRTLAYAAYGLWRIALGAFGGADRLVDGLRLLGESLPCPSCRVLNQLHGRWRCQACSGVYHGFCGRCPICGAGARFFPCDSCGVSIPLGSAR